MGFKAEKHVQLEKTIAPKFASDDVEYPEFKRKWKAQVSQATLPEKAE